MGVNCNSVIPVIPAKAGTLEEARRSAIHRTDSPDNRTGWGRPPHPFLLLSRRLHLKLTERTRIRNHPERAVPEEAADESEKFDLFDKMVQRYFLGRMVGHDYNAPPSPDLGVTALVEVKIEEWNAKARRGAPTGPDDDKPDALGSAGVIQPREV